MHSRIAALLLMSLSFAAPTAFAAVSPSDARLIALIPAGAQSVAGIEKPQNPHGHVLLVTHNNILDTEDWLALSGVDSHRGVDKLVWVAASSAGGALKEHLLLAAGSFDRAHIFAAAKQNGATSMWYDDIEALEIRPFAREKDEMRDTRWLVILDGQIAIFGSPAIVRQALDRHVAQAPADPQLLDRLEQLHTDVDSWNALRLPSSARDRQAVLGEFPGAFPPLFDSVSDLLLAVRYGSSTRVDFDARVAGSSHIASAQNLFADPSSPLSAFLDHSRPHVADFVADSGHVHGSLVLSKKEFEASLDTLRRMTTPPELVETAAAH